MKSIAEILLEMGFNKDSPLATQQAFIRNVIKAAQETTKAMPGPSSETKRTPDISTSKVKEEQLSFTFDYSPDKNKRRVS